MTASHQDVAQFYEDIWDRFDKTAFLDLMQLHRKRLLTFRERIAGHRCADVGCGQGAFSGAMARLGASQVFSIDVSRGAMRCLEQHAQHDGIIVPIRASALYVPLAARSIDFVVSNGVVQVTTEPRRAFHSMADILAPGGTIITAHFFRNHWTRALVTLRRPLPYLISRKFFSRFLDQLGANPLQHYFLVDLLYPSAPRPWMASLEDVIRWHEEEGLEGIEVSQPQIPGPSGLVLRLLGWTEVVAHRPR